MPSANPEPAPLQPIVSDDEDVQEKNHTKSQNRNLRKSRKRNQWEARKELTLTLTQGRLCHFQSCTGRTLAVRNCDHLHPLLHGPPALYRYAASELTSWDLHAVGSLARPYCRPRSRPFLVLTASRYPRGTTF
ncbi:hypothetical protein L1987_15433 [Smallanthus sonchifolius]|uniref:Uncharacterized protein n=1 Tax=Smallanthus sonchifolius TaxID=185202 RepID=A0ACB9J5X0_9ASTR|nr:hypothetical protein L1987_15433 [Smallanthus sonchifolius]